MLRNTKGYEGTCRNIGDHDEWIWNDIKECEWRGIWRNMTEYDGVCINMKDHEGIWMNMIAYEGIRVDMKEYGIWRTMKEY